MSAKTRVLFGILVVALAVVGFYLGTGPRAPEPQAQESVAEAEVPAPARADKVAPLPPRARDAGPPPPPIAEGPTEPGFDPFQGPMDDVLAEAHLKVLDGQRLDLPTLRKLVAYREEHPDDARANMLLARDSMAHMRHGEGVRLYRMAYKNDPTIAKDPRVLGDLVFVVAKYSRTEFREASDVIEMIYGDQAVPEIERWMAKVQASHDARATERLQTLKDRLLSK